MRFEWLLRYGSQRIRGKSIENVEAGSMKLRAIGIGRFLRVSSGLIILGLLVEIASFLWFHPLSFVLFILVGAALIGLGIVVYLISLVFAVSSPRKPRMKCGGQINNV